MKSQKKFSVQLTASQIGILDTVVDKVIKCMKLSGKEYYDDGNFLLSLSKDEMKELKKIQKIL